MSEEYIEKDVTVHVVLSNGEHVDTIETDLIYNGRGSILAEWKGRRHMIWDSVLFGEVVYNIVIPSWKAKEYGLAVA